MKKLLVFIFLIVMLFMLNFIKPTSLSEMFIGNSNEFYLLSNTDLTTLNNATKSADCYINKLNNFEVKNALNKANELYAESVVLYNHNLSKIVAKLNLKIISKNNIDGVTEIVGYSNKLPTSVSLNGEKVNIQLAINSGKIIVGYPLILQGF